MMARDDDSGSYHANDDNDDNENDSSIDQQLVARVRILSFAN